MGAQTATNIVNEGVYAGIAVINKSYVDCSDTTVQENNIVISGSNNVSISDLVQENNLIITESCLTSLNSDTQLEGDICTAITNAIQQKIKGITGGEGGNNVTNLTSDLAQAIYSSAKDKCNAMSTQINNLILTDTTDAAVYAVKQDNVSAGTLSCMASNTSVTSAYLNVINGVQTAISQKSTGFLTAIFDALFSGITEIVVVIVVIIGGIILLIVLGLVGGISSLTNPSGLATILLGGVAILSIFLIIAYLFSWYPYSNQLFGLQDGRNKTILIVSVILFVVCMIGLVAMSRARRKANNTQDVTTLLSGEPIVTLPTPNSTLPIDNQQLLQNPQQLQNPQLNGGQNMNNNLTQLIGVASAATGLYAGIKQAQALQTPTSAVPEPVNLPAKVPTQPQPSANAAPKTPVSKTPVSLKPSANAPKTPLSKTPVSLKPSAKAAPKKPLPKKPVSNHK